MATNKLTEARDYIGTQYNRLLAYMDANTPRNTRPKVKK